MSNVSLCKWVTFQKVEIILIFFLRNYLTFKYIYNSWLLLGNSNFRKPHVRSLTSSGCRWAWQPQLPHPCPATQPRLLHPWAELVPGLASAPQPCTEEAVPSASQTGPSLQGAAVWEAFWVGSLDCSVCTHMHVCTPRAFSMLKCHQLLSLPTPEQAREGQVSRVSGYLFSPGWACPMWGLNKSRAGRLPYSATSGLEVAPVFPSLDYHFKLHSSLLLFESSDHHPAFAPYFLTSPDSFSHLPARTQSAPSPVVLSLPQPVPQGPPPITSCSLHFQLLSLTTSLWHSHNPHVHTSNTVLPVPPDSRRAHYSAERPGPSGSEAPPLLEETAASRKQGCVRKRPLQVRCRARREGEHPLTQVRKDHSKEDTARGRGSYGSAGRSTMSCLIQRLGSTHSASYTQTQPQLFRTPKLVSLNGLRAARAPEPAGSVVLGWRHYLPP